MGDLALQSAEPIFSSIFLGNKYRADVRRSFEKFKGGLIAGDGQDKELCKICILVTTSSRGVHHSGREM